MRVDHTTQQPEADDAEAPTGEAPIAPAPTEQPAPPAAPLTEADRRAAFSAGAPRMSRKVVVLGIGVLLLIGVGGAVGDHFATSATPPPATSTRSPTGHSGPVVPSPPGASTVSSELDAPLSAFMGLSTLKSANAAGFALTDVATGAPVSLASLAGHVVVLTFANAPCDDLCPVLAKELVQADAALGSTKAPVTFVTVNTDPLAVSSRDAAMLTRTGLAALHNYRFLTGPISKLNPVWVAYGISITADHANHVVAHNDLMYFISPAGKIAWAATPFANESASRTYTLPATEIARFATGIAHYARKLANGS